ncbi:hypothetical protein BH23PAT2_BH23PAT2_05360 [soil metagenome]
MKAVISTSLEESYDNFPRIEEEFNAFLNETLAPRSPNMLLDLVRGLNLPDHAIVADVGCAEGKYTFELAKQLSCKVFGFDPIKRHIEEANSELQKGPEFKDNVSFSLGSAESLTLDDSSVDLIWCRDTLVHVEDLDVAFTEWRRVLSPNGYVIILHTYAADKLEPREAEWLWRAMQVVPQNTQKAFIEQAFHNSALEIETSTAIGSEWKEYREERTGKHSQHLLHLSRLLRSPERYIQKFGQRNYEIKVGDCLWHVYQMMGKISYQTYLLRVGERSNSQKLEA